MAIVKFALPAPWREENGQGLMLLAEDPRCDVCFQPIAQFPFPIEDTGRTLCGSCFRAIHRISMEELARQHDVHLVHLAPGAILEVEGRRYIVHRPLWEYLEERDGTFRLPVQVVPSGRRGRSSRSSLVVLVFDRHGCRGVEG